MAFLRRVVGYWITLFLVNLPVGSVFAAMTEIDLGQLPSAQEVKINLWYPDVECIDKQSDKLCLADNAITDKVLVFSHGAMGASIEYSWLAEGLAAQGYIVIGMNHFGESWAYGKESVDPRTTGYVWQRAQDISAVLTYLKDNNLFNKPVDVNHVVMIGHSAGGQTAAMLAGARFELAAITTYCDSPASKADLSCQYAKQSALAPAEFHKAFGSSQQDLRVSGIILLDPALGPTLVQDSLKSVQIPALVVGAEHNDFIPWEHHGARYAAALKNSQTYLLTGQEGHFVFLSPCTHDVSVMGVSLCKDRSGVDRSAVHALLLTKISSFLQEQDQAIRSTDPSAVITEQKKITLQQPMAGTSINPIEILKHTPSWVFGLLVGLIILGFLQARTRKVGPALAFSLPFFMLFLSFNGVVSNLGWQGMILVCWSSGLAIATWEFVKISAASSNAGKVRWDEESSKFLIQGSWVPLVIFMAIFFTRYSLGVATAMNAPLLREPLTPLVSSLFLGVMSGFFVARAITYWRVKKAVV